ncbi:hypothetical protein [Sorangium sp. So ce204]|uniref:hypothetical protein n=1 Tax=Sorangium sp. So ce204 TaxID=3133288 RepID=UPI003F63DCC7
MGRGASSAHGAPGSIEREELDGGGLHERGGRHASDVLATRSHVIIGGHVHENPYYLDPVTFLRKLALRRAPVSLANAG